MDEDEQIENEPHPLVDLMGMALSGQMIDMKSVVGILLTNHAIATDSLTFMEINGRSDEER